MSVARWVARRAELKVEQSAALTGENLADTRVGRSAANSVKMTADSMDETLADTSVGCWAARKAVY
jgi:hypothetical protein